MWSTRRNSKNISDGAIKNPDSACFISCAKFSSVISLISLPGWLNYEIPSGPPFWAHYTLKLWKIARYFTIPSRTVPPLFHHVVQVYNSVDKAEHLQRHFKRTIHLTLEVGTTNHASVVNPTVSDLLRRPPPSLTSMRLGSKTHVASDV